MEINNLKVNEIDPFFTAEKWNESVSFIKTFEGLIYSILGAKFKGIYDPTIEYQINDYVWFNGKCYIITGFNNRTVLKSIVKKHQKSAHLLEDSYLSIHKNKLYKINNNFEEKLSDLGIDDFIYLEDKNFVIAKSNGKLTKVFMNGEYEYINAKFEKDIKSYCLDDFGIYACTSNEILFSEIHSEEETTYKVLFTANDVFLDIAVFNEYLVILTRDKIIVLNKTTLSYRIFEVSIIKPEKAKITCSSQNEFYIYDGLDKIFSVFINNETVKITHILQKSEFNNLTSLKSTKGNITITTDEYITSFMASKYSLTEIDPRMLIVSKSTLSITNSTFAVDFSKGELGSSFNNIYPIGYTNTGNEITNGTYQNSSLNLTFLKENSISINQNSNLKYNIPTFSESIFIFEIENTNKVTDEANLIINDGNGKRYSFTTGKEFNENSPYKIFILIKNNKAEKIEFRNSTIFNQIKVNPTSVGSVASIELYSKANESFRIKQVIQLPYQEMQNIDYLSNCKLIFKTPNDCLAFTNITHDNNGLPGFKTHATLIKEKTGLKVKNSSNYNLNDPNTMLNTVGSKNIGDRLNQIETDIDRIEAIANHPHPYMQDGGTYGTIFLSNWIRTTGSTGWFNETFGGGLYMQDSTWIRAYNNKKFYVSNAESDAINTAGGVSANSLTLNGWKLTIS